MVARKGRSPVLSEVEGSVFRLTEIRAEEQARIAPQLENRCSSS